MDLDEIKRGLRAEIKKRENEQYATFQCNVRQMCKDVLAKLEEQESLIKEMREAAANIGLEWHDYDAGEDAWEDKHKGKWVLQMSELKTYIGPHPTDHTLTEYYLKSEADKVIALLTDKANYNDYVYKHKSEELADTCMFYEEELRHQKYKRCLAMAKLCHAMWFLLRFDKKAEKSVFYWRWWNIWLELTEKFKEAK